MATRAAEPLAAEPHDAPPRDAPPRDAQPLNAQQLSAQRLDAQQLDAQRLDAQLLDEIIAATPGGESLRSCLQCGTCGGSCPSAADMDHTPRQLFALLAAGLRDEALASNTFWYCVSCYYCTVRCPQQIPVTDVMYTLKRRAIAAGYARRVDAGDFAHTFIGMIERYGRSFELGLATRFHLTHAPLRKVDMMGALALDMATHDRLALRPRRIRDLAGLRAILRKAHSLSQAAETTGGTAP